MRDSAYPAPMRLQIALVAVGGFAALASALILVLHGSDPAVTRLFWPIFAWGAVAVVLAFVLRQAAGQALNLFGLFWLVLAGAAYVWLRWTHG